MIETQYKENYMYDQYLYIFLSLLTKSNILFPGDKDKKVNFIDLRLDVPISYEHYLIIDRYLPSVRSHGTSPRSATPSTDTKQLCKTQVYHPFTKPTIIAPNFSNEHKLENVMLLCVRHCVDPDTHYSNSVDELHG